MARVLLMEIVFNIVDKLSSFKQALGTKLTKKYYIVGISKAIDL
jgi:hypothetical protein